MTDSCPLVTAKYTTLANIDWSPCNNKVAYVALSGGIDSVVLLHLAKSHLSHVRAIHINHNLQAASAQWQRFCEQLCQDWHIPFETVSVNVEQTGNVEAQARSLRYEAMAAAMAKDDLLLTAHHADDLAETFLLQLKRGAGLKGLTSLKRLSQLPINAARQMIFRPMLTCKKIEIEAYAEAHHLVWCDDPSNASTTFDRNFLRHRVFPQLYERWPHFSDALGRTVNNLQEQMMCLDEVVSERLASCVHTENELDLNALAQYSGPWQSQLLMKFFEQNQLAVSRAHLAQINAIIHSKADAQGQFCLGQCRIYRYRTRLIIELQRHSLALQVQNLEILQENKVDAQAPVRPFFYWDGVSFELSVNRIVGTTNQKACRFVDIALSEKITPWGALHSKPIKQWCKLWDIPPWHRQPIQLFLHEEQALAIVTPFIVIPLTERGQYRISITHVPND